MTFQRRNGLLLALLTLAAACCPTLCFLPRPPTPSTTLSAAAAWSRTRPASSSSAAASAAAATADFVRRSVFLQSAVADMFDDANLTSTSEVAEPSKSSRSSSSPTPPRKYDMPWSELQEWALRDNLAKYTVQVHITEDNGRDVLRAYTLWRTLSNEVTALSGYPLQFLVDRYQEISIGPNDEAKTGVVLVETSTEILPYLDGYTFETDGGLAGRVYGIAGVAQGTRIQTTPVAGVESTLQKGYVLTEEGIVYELGLPIMSASSVGSHSKGDAATMALDRTSQMAERAAASVQSAAAHVGEASDDDLAGTGQLAKLGALTAVILSGAWAMETLSHHLTVNVFWV